MTFHRTRDKRTDRFVVRARRHLNTSLSALARLHILVPQSSSTTNEYDDQEGQDSKMDSEAAGRTTVNDTTLFRLNNKFRSSLRQALTGGYVFLPPFPRRVGPLKADMEQVTGGRGKPGAFGTISSEQDPKVTIYFLDQHAETQWEVRFPSPSLLAFSFFFFWEKKTSLNY